MHNIGQVSACLRYSAHSVNEIIDKFEGWMILVFTFVVTIIKISKIMIKECLQRNPVDDMNNYIAGRLLYTTIF